MACSDATLCETPRGSVVHRADCDRLEIAFLGERLRVPPSDFGAVAETVAWAWGDVQAALPSCGRWRLTAKTAAGPVVVTFVADELAALYDLLHGAQAIREPGPLLHDVLYS